MPTGSAWLCKNPKCGLMFQWNPLDQIARYVTVIPKCSVYPKGKNVPTEIEVGGTKKPSFCPRCHGTDIESLGE